MISRLRFLHLVACIPTLCAVLHAATAPAPRPLWTGDTESALVAFLPAANAHSGAAVLILSSGAGNSGGDNDATQLARWLNEKNVAAFVVRTTASAAEARGRDGVARRALRVLRAHAADYGVSPKRVAVVGLGTGAQTAAQIGYAAVAVTSGADAIDQQSDRPALLALVWGAAVPANVSADAPPTLLIGSSATADKMTEQVELWGKLRAVRASVDAHLFARAEGASGLAASHPSLGTWPELFFTWARFHGLLTEQSRVPLKGMVYLDGKTLPHGYVILTPIDQVGAGPVVGRVLNSTQNVPMGQFTIPAVQGPIAGRYKVDVRQNMNRWLSNSFSGGLVSGGRGGSPVTPEQVHFGHHRVLTPSIDDQRSFTKVRPTDREDYVIEIKPGAEANQEMKIEVFSGAASPARAASSADGAAGDAIGGILGGPKNPGQTAYVEQIKGGAIGKVPGIPEPILLWPKGAPEAVPDANGVFTDEDKPAIYAFPVTGGTNTGAAMLVIPGGGFTNRCMDNEGVQIARFLNRNGIAGFVLRYRIGPNYPRRTFSTADAQRALRHIRANAAEYKINPDRIGTIGFSAGAELQGDAFYNGATEGDANAADSLDRVSAKANFCALIYGGRNLQQPASCPPTFLFNTIEDLGHLNVQVSVLNSLRQAGVPVQAHFYQVGPHGTAMSPGDPLLGQWPDQMVRWMRASGWLASAAR